MKNGFKLFWKFTILAKDEILLDKKLYLNAFLWLVLLANIDLFYPLFKIDEESNTFLVLNIISTLLTFVVLSQVVLIQKQKKGGSGQLRYFVPTFLLYNLYYSSLFFMGLLFLVIPGFYILFYFSLAPLIAVLDDSEAGNYFSKSKALVKKNLPLVVCATSINLALELTALILNPIEDPIISAIAKFVFSIPEAFLSILMAVIMVKIYYELKEIKEPQVLI
jgi:hypothetical protein